MVLTVLWESGVHRRAPCLGACPQPWRHRWEPGSLSREGLLMDSSQVLGSTDATSGLPTPIMSHPWQDPRQGRQLPCPHPAGQKSLNSGLRKVFVQLETRTPQSGMQGRGTVWVHLAPSSASFLPPRRAAV